MNDDWATNIYNKTIAAGEVWAGQDAAWRYLEDCKKTVLAQIASKFSGSNAAAKDSALASQEYQDHLDKLQAARSEVNLSRVRYDALVMLAKLRQSQESTKRAEMNL